MRTVRLASLLIAAVVLTTACEKTVDSPGKGDTATPYGGADASVNGSIGSTPGYMNAAGVRSDSGKPATDRATPVGTPAPRAAADTSTQSPQ